MRDLWFLLMNFVVTVFVVQDRFLMRNFAIFYRSKTGVNVNLKKGGNKDSERSGDIMNLIT